MFAGTRKRLAKELKDWRADPSTVRFQGALASARDYFPQPPVPMIEVHPNDPFQLLVVFPGPRDTPYEGGIFVWKVRLAQDYPFRWGKDHLVTPIYHCNFNEMGAHCLSSTSEQWSPALTVLRIFGSVYSIFTDPNPDDPQRPAIAAQYRSDRAAHDEQARDWTRRHATAQDASARRHAFLGTRRHGWRSSPDEEIAWESERLVWLLCAGRPTGLPPGIGRLVCRCLARKREPFLWWEAACTTMLELRARQPTELTDHAARPAEGDQVRDIARAADEPAESEANERTMSDRSFFKSGLSNFHQIIEP